MQLVVFKEDAFAPIKYVVCVKRYDYNPENNYPGRPQPENKYYVKVSFINQDWIITEFKVPEERDEWYYKLKEALEKRKD